MSRLLILTISLSGFNAWADPNGFVVNEGTIIDQPYLCFDQEGREVLAGKLSKGIECCKQAEACYLESRKLIEGEVNMIKEKKLPYFIVGLAMGLVVGVVVGQLNRGR